MGTAPSLLTCCPLPLDPVRQGLAVDAEEVAGRAREPSAPQEPICPNAAERIPSRARRAPSRGPRWSRWLLRCISTHTRKTNQRRSPAAWTDEEAALTAAPRGGHEGSTRLFLGAEDRTWSARGRGSCHGMQVARGYFWEQRIPGERSDE